jgi:hypothetical protein
MFTGSFITLSVLTANEVKRSREFEQKVDQLVDTTDRDKVLEDILKELEQIQKNQGNAAVSKDITDIKTLINDLDAKIGKQTETVTTDLTGVQTTLSSQIAGILNDLAGLQKELLGDTENPEDKGLINSQFEDLYALIGDREAELRAFIGEAITAYGELTETLGGISGQLTDAADTDTIAYKLAAAQESITAIQTDLASAVAEINAIKGLFTESVPVLDENGDPVSDENGDPVMQDVLGGEAGAILKDLQEKIGGIDKTVEDLFITTKTIDGVKTDVLGGKIGGVIQGLIDAGLARLDKVMLTTGNIKGILNDGELEINKALEKIQDTLKIIQGEQDVIEAQDWIREVLAEALKEFYETYNGKVNFLDLIREIKGEITPASVTGDEAVYAADEEYLFDRIGYDYETWFGTKKDEDGNPVKKPLTGIDLATVKSIDTLRFNLSRAFSFETENLTKKVKEITWAEITEVRVEWAEAVFDDLLNGDVEYVTAPIETSKEAFIAYIRSLEYTSDTDADGNKVADRLGEELLLKLLGENKDGNKTEDGIVDELKEKFDAQKYIAALKDKIETLVQAYYDTIDDADNTADDKISVLEDKYYAFADWFFDPDKLDKNLDLDKIVEYVLTGVKDYDISKAALTNAVKLKIYIAASDYWLDLIDEEMTRIKATKAYDENQIQSKLENTVLNKITAVRGTTVNKDSTLEELAEAIVKEGSDIFLSKAKAANGTIIREKATEAYLSLAKNSAATQKLINQAVIDYYLTINDDNDPEYIRIQALEKNEGETDAEFADRVYAAYLAYIRPATYLNYTYRIYFRSASAWVFTNLTDAAAISNAEYEEVFATVYASFEKEDGTVGYGLTEAVKEHIFKKGHIVGLTRLVTAEVAAIKALGICVNADVDTWGNNLKGYLNDLVWDDPSDNNDNGIDDREATDFILRLKAYEGLVVDETKVDDLKTAIGDALDAFYTDWFSDASTYNADDGTYADNIASVGYTPEKWFGADADGFKAFADITSDDLTNAELIAGLVKIGTGNASAFTISDALKQYTLDQTKIAWVSTLETLFGLFESDQDFPGRWNFGKPGYAYADYYNDQVLKLKGGLIDYLNGILLPKDKPDETLGTTANEYAMAQFGTLLDNPKGVLQAKAKTDILDLIQAYYDDGLDDTDTDKDDDSAAYLWLLESDYGAEGKFGYQGSYWFENIVNAATYYDVTDEDGNITKGFLSLVKEVYTVAGDGTKAFTDNAVKAKIVERVYAQWVRFLGEKITEMTADGTIIVPDDLKDLANGYKSYWEKDPTVKAAYDAIVAEFAKVKTIGDDGKAGITADQAREFYTKILTRAADAAVKLITIDERKASVKEPLENALNAYYATIYDDSEDHTYNQRLEYFGYAYETWFSLDGVSVENADSYDAYLIALKKFIDADGNLVNTEKERVYDAANKAWQKSLTEAYEEYQKNYLEYDLKLLYEQAMEYIQSGRYDAETVITGRMAREYAENLFENAGLTDKESIQGEITAKKEEVNGANDYYATDIDAFVNAVDTAYAAENATAASVIGTLNAEFAKLVKISGIRAEAAITEADYYAKDYEEYTTAVTAAVNDPDGNKTGAAVSAAVAALKNGMNGKKTADVEALIENLYSGKVGFGYPEEVLNGVREEANKIKDNATSAQDAINQINELFNNLKNKEELVEEVNKQIDEIEERSPIFGYAGKSRELARTRANQLVEQVEKAGEYITDKEIQQIILDFVSYADSALYDTSLLGLPPAAQSFANLNTTERYYYDATVAIDNRLAQLKAQA